MTNSYPITKMLSGGYLRALARTRGWPFIASWAHRITGVLLLLYVLFHIITLSSLRVPENFESKMRFFESFIPGYFEWLLAIPVIYHALNGGRLVLYEIFGNRKDQIVSKWVIGLSTAYTLLLGLFMILGNQAVSAIFFWVYVVVASGFITYITVIKIRVSGASLFWKLQRISGAFLFLMIPAHMLFMHLDPAIGRDAQVIIARMSNSFIKLIDLLLLIAVLYHGAYGLIGICQDYLSSQRVRTGSTVFIVFMTVIFAWVGIKLTVLI